MLRQLQFGILGLEKQRGLDVCSNGLCLYGTEHNEKSSIVRIHQNAEAENRMLRVACHTTENIKYFPAIIIFSIKKISKVKQMRCREPKKFPGTISQLLSFENDIHEI